MSSFRDLLGRVRAEIDEVEAEELHDRLGRGRIQILDVREDDEVRGGVIPGAVHLSRAHFESRVEKAVPDKDAPVIVYCASGNRSAFASRTLRELGYREVSSLRGGFIRWKELGYGFDIPRLLEAAHQERYSRQLILPGVGEEGQRKLLESKVLCIGAGGLASPALLYLTAAGVGTIGIVDSDVVEESNLQRQVIHDTARIGVLKADSAKGAIERLNPDVHVEAHAVRLEASNARDLIAPYDVVVDGCDNFETRYVVNDAAVALGKPVVHGSISRYEGMASTFVPHQGPCYRCLYPDAPPPELVPT